MWLPTRECDRRAWWQLNSGEGFRGQFPKWQWVAMALGDEPLGGVWGKKGLVHHWISVHSHSVKYKIFMEKRNFYIKIFFPQRTFKAQSYIKHFCEKLKIQSINQLFLNIQKLEFFAFWLDNYIIQTQPEVHYAHWRTQHSWVIKRDTPPAKFLHQATEVHTSAEIKPADDVSWTQSPRMRPGLEVPLDASGPWTLHLSDGRIGRSEPCV